MTGEKIKLHIFEENLMCMKCGNQGAIKEYGIYYAEGVGSLADSDPKLEGFRNVAYMDATCNEEASEEYRCSNSGCDNFGFSTNNKYGAQPSFLELTRKDG